MIHTDKIQELENYIQTLIAELDLANRKLRDNVTPSEEVHNDNSGIIITLQEENKRLNNMLKEKIADYHNLNSERDRFKL